MERDRRWGSGKDYRTTAALLRICWVLGPWRIGPSDVRPRHRSCRTGRRNRPVGSGCQGAPRRRLGGVLILTQSEAHLFLRERWFHLIGGCRLWQGAAETAGQFADMALSGSEPVSDTRHEPWVS